MQNQYQIGFKYWLFCAGEKIGQGQIWKCLYGSIKINKFFTSDQNYQQKTVKIVLNVRTTAFRNKTSVIHEASQYFANVWSVSWPIEHISNALACWRMLIQGFEEKNLL